MALYAVKKRVEKREEKEVGSKKLEVRRSEKGGEKPKKHVLFTTVHNFTLHSVDEKSTRLQHSLFRLQESVHNCPL